MNTLIAEIEIEKSNGKSLPIYEQIRQQLRNCVKSGSIKGGERLPSINRMVNEWGVGYETVKTAMGLLEKDGLIRYEKSTRCGAIVVKPKKVKKKASITFVRWGSWPIFSELGDGIQAFLKEQEEELTIVDANSDLDIFFDSIASPPNGTNGLLLYPLETPKCYEAVKKAQGRGIEVVFLDRTLPDMRVSSVTADHFAGAYKIVKHLMTLHDLPVYYLGHKSQPSSCFEHYQGWRAAMQEHDFAEEEFLWEVSFSELETLHIRQDCHCSTVCEHLERLKKDKYCIFAINDYFAKSVYLAAEKMGLKIGKDIFVAGFGNLPFCQRLDVPLTSVAQSNKKVGYQAAKVLYHDLLGSDNPKIINQILPVELCIRQSSTGKGDNVA